MADLTVWLYERKVAHIFRARGQLRLQYTDEALNDFDLGTPVLSLSLPLRHERYTHLPVKAFLDGLLPEGEARRLIARELRLASEDTFGLIRELGRDCAGALIIQPADDPPPPRATTLTARPLSDSEMAILVTNLKEAPLGFSQRVRISLAGVQEKLLLTRLPDGAWGQPVDGTPSTHILKPEISRFPRTVENELFCMRTAKHLGLPVAEVGTQALDSRTLIVVERFDRVVSSDGAVVRLHQEDFCQATATSPERKYEEDGGPSLRQIATILQNVASLDSLETFLRAVTFNVLIGNGDAHAKNFSLIYEPGGSIRLAPLYDLLCTVLYGQDTLAMFIDGVHRISRVTGRRILSEASTWGMPSHRASQILHDVLDKVIETAHRTALDTPDTPPAILETIRAQHQRLVADL